jgi:hypothetical protein
MAAIIYFLLIALTSCTLISLQLTKATTLGQTHPSYVPVCPGDTVTFTCTTTGQLYWSLNKITAATFTSSSNIGSTSQLLDPFTLTLTNKSGPSNQILESTAIAVNVNYSLNGMSIYCSNNIFNFAAMSALITVTG